MSTFTDDLISSVTTALHALTRQEREAQRRLNMIPSENHSSPLARIALGLDSGHRYFFNTGNDPNSWNFPAAREASQVETDLTLPLLRHLARADHVNVRPLSGLQAMALVLSALGGGPGTPVISIHTDQGGHYATAGLARRLGLVPVLARGPDPHTLDLDALTTLVARHRPCLVYLDLSHALFPLDTEAVVTAVRAARTPTLVHVDISHWMGLVLGGAIPHPLDAGADSMGGSTHKTFPGPQHALIATRDAHAAAEIGLAQQEMISNHHLAATCALGLAAAEFLAADPQEYAQQVIASARLLGGHLAERGLPPAAAERGYSGGHQLWVDSSIVGVDAVTAGRRLDEAGISVNVLTDLPGMQGRPALRLGVAEPLSVGLTADDMPLVAELLTAAVFSRRPADLIAEHVAALRAARVPRWRLADQPQIAAALRQLSAQEYAA
ncbi:hypothetical protein AB0I81_60895 [Nonomuraea sp. NPDC050404]|uniref:hypothetical protein n=1 Tax=Nonomuraea sp. NPDC050404 TaxID=3155783 RepID=UPI0033FFAE87